MVFFDDAGERYQPVKHANRITGHSAYRVKPDGALNHTSEFLELETIEEVAKAMLVDGFAARIKAFRGGPVPVLKFGADVLARYELDPGIAARLNIPARAGRVPATTGPTELERLRRRFLNSFPDFETVGAFAATSGAYHDKYRVRVDELLAAVAAHREDGWSVLRDILAASQGGRGALPQFFDGDVNWRVPRARDADPSGFDAALDALIAGRNDPAVAAVTFNEIFRPALEAVG